MKRPTPRPTPERRPSRLARPALVTSDGVRWWEWQNDSSYECPPGGVIEITTELNDPERLHGTRPGITLHPYYALNGDDPVPAGETGLLSYDSPLFGLHAPGDDPLSPRASFGPLPDSWLLHESWFGFRPVGFFADDRGLFLNHGILHPFHCRYTEGDPLMAVLGDGMIDSGFKVSYAIMMDPGPDGIHDQAIVVASFMGQGTIIAAECPPEPEE